MANIRKREGKRGTKYQVQIRLADRGKLTRTFDSHAEAVSWARDEEAMLQRAERGGGERRPLGDAIDRYTELVLHTKAPSTQYSNGRRLKWWFDEYGDVRLDRLTPQLLANVRDRLRKQASGPTANRYLGVLSHVLTVASREWGWIRDNPMRRVKRCPEHQPRVRFLTPEETQDLLQACLAESRALHTLVVIALSTGMRRGEITNLTWKNIDLKNRLIVLETTKNHERRGIPISDSLFTELSSMARRIDTDLLFPGPKDPKVAETFQKSWQRAVEKAGIKNFRFHDLRHTVASHMAMSGATEREIAEVLGHKTMAMVKRYSHLSKAHVAGLLNRVSSALIDPEAEPGPTDEDRRSASGERPHGGAG